mmetsp:Transcript_17844/g.27580  ORF Transcript_17844/g.27580 Transcript_17844/m.27580 type:complete len:120 (+) Transcript_17844:35-394(+)|eukprot:CAMPEP_0184290660 /NCGR_PEP_ID=MMETSP1049-20130417/2839_1 /TAXON_ID=77928 /ORGANISM="Proteomonas sulcata, Strain CCMP704" /LENGTH=119 /DNA_ID=CAMNT_0026597861 /DNA_START=17 /DNA_END=376 /DNA_ORIENTATION=-
MPMLTINTNVDLGTTDSKKILMTKLTEVIAKGLGKPDSYVAIHLNDQQCMLWGGSDEPCALCTVASLGAINLKNNETISSDICTMLSGAPYGIKPDRTYIEFRDMPRENCGYNGKTFAK